MSSVDMYPGAATLTILELSKVVEEISEAAFDCTSTFDGKAGDDLYYLVYWKLARELTVTSEILKLGSFIVDEFCWFESHLRFLYWWLERELAGRDDIHKLACKGAVKDEVADTVFKMRKVLELASSGAFKKGKEKKWGKMARGKEWDEHACDSEYNDCHVLYGSAFLAHAEPLLEALENHPHYQHT